MAEEHAAATATEQAAHKAPNYVLIFVWLIVVTAAEVGIGYIPHTLVPVTVVYPVLMIMAIAKILLVALYYMHLRYESRWFLLFMLVAMPLSVLFILALILGFIRH